MEGPIRTVTVVLVLVVAGVLASACSSPRGIPTWSGNSTTSSIAAGSPEPGASGPYRGTGPPPETESGPGADEPSRVCSIAVTFGSDGVAGRSGSALLVSGSATPEPGDVPVRDRLEQMGFLVTVQDDDVVTAGDAAGMDLVLISESVSSSAIGATFTPLAVPVLVWERSLFSELKMSDENNWHTDPQDTIFLPDPSSTCGVSGEVTVASSDAFPMNRAQPAVSARVFAIRSPDTEEAVWFAYGTGDALTDGSPAPAARVALWFSYDTPLHTNESGWRLFVQAVAFAIGTSLTVERSTQGATEDPGLAATDTTVTAPPGTSPTGTDAATPPTTGPDTATPTVTAPGTAPPTVTTAAPNTPSPTTAPPNAASPTTTPRNTASPTTASPTTASPTTSKPSVTPARPIIPRTTTTTATTITPTTTTATTTIAPATTTPATTTPAPETTTPATTTTAPETTTTGPETTTTSTTVPPPDEPPGEDPSPSAGAPPPAEPDDPDTVG